MSIIDNWNYMKLSIIPVTVSEAGLILLIPPYPNPYRKIHIHKIPGLDDDKYTQSEMSYKRL